MPYIGQVAQYRNIVAQFRHAPRIYVYKYLYIEFAIGVGWSSLLYNYVCACSCMHACAYDYEQMFDTFTYSNLICLQNGKYSQRETKVLSMDL